MSVRDRKPMSLPFSSLQDSWWQNIIEVQRVLSRWPLSLLFPPNVEKLTKNRDITGLIQALSYRSDGGHTSRMAAEALVLMGRMAVTSLVAVLNDGIESARECATWTLGVIGDDRAVEPLITALSDHNEHVRELAASALGKIGDKRAVEPLIAVLGDSLEMVRANAATALGWLHDDRAEEPLTAMRNDHSKLVQEKVTVALYRLRRPDEGSRQNDSVSRTD